MKTPVLRMNHITKKFPGVTALSDVSISAYPGEILSIVGENGAGKSTLMKILSGSYSYGTYEGELLVEEQPVRFDSVSRSESAGIAMIYQELNMNLDMSVAENIFLARWNKFGFSINWDALEKKAAEYIEMLDLNVEPGDILRNLSASKQQLVSIARAISKDPRILVLDEPTASLTLSETQKLFAIMHKLKDQGYTCILISHKLDEVFDNSDRIIVMRDGKVVNTHIKGDFDQSTIISEMVGRKIDNLYPKEPAPIGETVLSVENISVEHPQNPKKQIVSGVSFEVRKGEILGIGGLVGSGRSELVNAVFGKIPRLSGSIYIDGRPRRITNPREAINAGIALVTEDRKTDGLVMGMNIKENITLASLKDLCVNGIIQSAKEKTSAQSYFDKLDVKANDMYVMVNTLSGGNQQKVVLGKWLMRNPRVLILDEPTRGIDVGTKYEIYKIMVSLAKQGIAIIMISSELPELISMCDRIVVLSGGKVSGELSANEATQESVMALATDFR